MEVIARGDVVLVVQRGDYGKPRPAVVVQSDLFNRNHASITICPCTTEFVRAPIFRVDVTPDGDNGLVAPSQVMVDKAGTVRRDRIKRRIGVLGPVPMRQIDLALRVWFGLA
jgi:mRNA interferase MazF